MDLSTGQQKYWQKFAHLQPPSQMLFSTLRFICLNSLGPHPEALVPRFRLPAGYLGNKHGVVKQEGKCHSESSISFNINRRSCANFWAFGRVGVHLARPSGLLEVLRFFSNCAHHGMKKLSLPALIVVLISMTSASFGANYYVRKGATGTNKGTDWTNAWNEMNQVNFSTLACGDTVWIAGGSYTTSLNGSKSCTSGSILTFNRVQATDSVPVAAAGWSASYDSQVILPNISVPGPAAYITFNGRAWQGGVVGSGGIQVLIPGSSGDGIDASNTGSGWPCH